ncbi:MAG: transcriptional repressor [Candidatus Krumholzibacteriia bacterium]
MKPRSFRITRQRRVILDELQHAKDHPTASQLYDRVRLRLPRISLGTVYRNLDRLSGEGLVRRLELAGQETRFDADLSAHDHLRCSGCGRVDDMAAVVGDLLDRARAELPGYRVDSYDLEFRGLCPDCHSSSNAPEHPLPRSRSKPTP